MSALSLRLEASKLHKSRWDGFPTKPRSSVRRGHSPPSLLFAAAQPYRPTTPTLAEIRPELSPLPSPLLSPAHDLDPLENREKTNAFFKSPWTSMIPDPIPPPMAKSEDVDVTPSIDENQVPGASSGPVDIPSPTEVRSQTIDFFNTSSATKKHAPTPPPSIRYASPDEKSELTSRIALARLFPYSASSEPKRPEDSDHVALSRSSSHSSSVSKPRDFIYWTPESSDLSRSSSRSSVSGYRRDLTLTDASATIGPSSYSPVSPTSLIFSRLNETREPDTISASPTEMAKPTPLPVAPAQQHPTHSLVRRETQRANQLEPKLEAGSVIGDEVPLRLLRLQGQGAFSSVWLAEDVNGKLIPAGPKQKRRKTSSFARKAEDHMTGIRPSATSHVRHTGGVLNELDGEGACLPKSPDQSETVATEARRLVAVKLLDRSLCDVNDRTRISFVREVEVLRHISHPSIVAYLHSFSIPTHHCLVLEQVGGGELFELMNSDDNHARMTSPLLRRMWGELCRAVGWLHGVALVHRDIKLENILLTVNPFLLPGPVTLDTLPQPLLKLSDFGLARFIDPKNPMLSTRCGSESYAAPEIVTGSRYDGRQTDAWACGVVLYALAVRTLPFDGNQADNGRGSRRRYLIRIAKAEYSWPDDAALATPELKQVVARLLVRDPTKRARIVDLWDEEWMRGEGSPSPPWRIAAKRKNEEETRHMEENIDEDEEGMLVDAHDIRSIASQELE